MLGLSPSLCGVNFVKIRIPIPIFPAVRSNDVAKFAVVCALAIPRLVQSPSACSCAENARCATARQLTGLGEAGKDVAKGRIEHATPDEFGKLVKRFPGCRVTFEATMNYGSPLKRVGKIMRV